MEYVDEEQPYVLVLLDPGHLCRMAGEDLLDCCVRGILRRHPGYAACLLVIGLAKWIRD
eukprot:SM013883S00147  [mRNA]  locus=s13883:37:210:- [translate_table: standard]